MNNSNIIKLFLDGLSILLTAIIALYAIGGDYLRKVFNQPKLKIETYPEKPYYEEIPNIESSEEVSDYNENYISIRVKVSNITEFTAIKCQGFVQNVIKKSDDTNKDYNYEELIPTPLLWCDEQEMKTIKKNIGAYIEIARIKRERLVSQNPDTSESENEDYREEYKLYLAIQKTGVKGVFIELGRGTFKIPITFTGENLLKTVRKTLKITWTGDKLDDLNHEKFYVEII